MSRQLWLLRHGATEWALKGRHTGSTDLPLLPEGEAEAHALGPVLSQQAFAAVFSSPLQRAQRTCELAGLGDQMQICDDIIEWNYGDYEGITTATIRETVPDWTAWSHGWPNGEDAPQVEARCTTAISRALAVPGDGDVALFAHGHILRALAGTWLGLGAAGGQLLLLGTASVSILGWERDTRAIQRWNAPSTGNC
ncbi:histidine phosphatase family protein [Synechococcus sp. A15-24]|uniref:histidine phosphatase family protein n=1 Tax=Synechococcus sp. A15-24 TaxID=1050635 RepID=UPI0016480517|nr:histidine phosphatase family protein [Synechococcus sp. A15-24]QNJ28511.1 putative phosphoglycerate mutase [Synechococcus sp. A15-24]